MEAAGGRGEEVDEDDRDKPVLEIKGKAVSLKGRLAYATLCAWNNFPLTNATVVSSPPSKLLILLFCVFLVSWLS